VPGKRIGIDHPHPLDPFSPVLMFTVLFGLSTDYEVLLALGNAEQPTAASQLAASFQEGAPARPHTPPACPRDPAISPARRHLARLDTHDNHSPRSKEPP
jgi:uncharacterized membrane protein YdfJ with MMPL/SSD domain